MDNNYGKYFLAFEEDTTDENNTPENPEEQNNGENQEEPPVDDNIEVTSEAQPKKNLKIIDIKPRSSSRFDIPDDEDIPLDTEVPSAPVEGEVPPAETTPAPVEGEVPTAPVEGEVPPAEGGDMTAIGEAPTGEVPQTTGEVPPAETTPAPVEGEVPPAPVEGEVPPAETTPAPVEGETPPAEGSEQPPVEGEQPIVDDGTDFSMDEQNPEGGEQPPEEGEQPNANGPGLEYDSTRKYILFKNYISLSNAIDNYISKIEVKMGDNSEETLVLKNATDKLKEIGDLCYDFITMKFEISTYVQSLLFFQKLVVMVQMVFDLIDKGNKTIKKDIDTKKQ